MTTSFPLQSVGLNDRVMGSAIRKLADIRKTEFRVVSLLFLFFFLVIAVFQSLYGLKKGLFVECYGADVELYAKLANILMAAAGVITFTYLCTRFTRQRSIQLICLFFVACFLPLSLLLRDPANWSIWSFYLLVDLVTTLLVAGFWAYATDLFSVGQAKRWFGVVGGGGILGGLFGSGVTYLLLDDLGMTGLILISAVMMIGIILVTSKLGRAVSGSDAFYQYSLESPNPSRKAKNGLGFGVLFEAAKLVLRTPYLAAIVGIVAFYEMASQVMDYQLSYMFEGYSGVYATQEGFSDVRFYTSVLSVFVQFLLVGFLMRRFGLVTALLILPISIVAFSGAFIALPTLFVVSNMNICHNGLNYSVQQTGRESMWMTTDPKESRARPFTNMLVQRVAKGLAVALVLGLQLLRLEIRYLSILTILFAAAMIVCSVYAGRVFQSRAQAIEKDA